MNDRPHHHHLILILVIICSFLQGCATSVEQVPTAEQNKLLLICTNLLVTTNDILSQHRAKLPTQVKQRVTSLLASAEINNQFEQYPVCVDKLERARYFLSQTKLMIPSPTYWQQGTKPLFLIVFIVQYWFYCLKSICKLLEEGWAGQENGTRHGKLFL